MTKTIIHNYLIEIQYKKQINWDRVQAQISFNFSIFKSNSIIHRKFILHQSDVVHELSIFYYRPVQIPYDGIP